jgi:hypothetical protein
MCRIIDDDDLQEEIIYAQPGENVIFTWAIINLSKYSWPRFPILKNISLKAKIL